MEEFEDNDFSELYADVEVQASSAITALQRLTVMPPGNNRIADKATRGDEREGDGSRFSGAEIARTNGGFSEHATRGDEGFGLTKLPMENGVTPECDDGNKQRFDGNRGNSNSSFEFGAVNTRKHGGVSSGDYSSQNLIHDCSDYKMTRVNGMDSQLCMNGDVDEDSDRDHYFRRANRGNRLVYGRNGGAKIASERVPTHAHTYDPAHISDSIENSRHVVSESDSEGTSDRKKYSSDDTKNRKNSSSMCSGGSSFPTPCPSLNDGDESYKHSKKLSSFVVRESEEEATREYHHSFKDSRKHQVKPKAGAGPTGRHCERQRGSSRHNKSDDMQERKTRRTNEDASFLSIYEKQRAMVNIDSNERDMSSDFYPNVHVGPSKHFKKQIYPDIHPSIRYKEGWFDVHDTSDRRNILQRNRKLDNKAFENDRYHHRRRHIQCSSSEQSRRLLPKYPSTVGTRGARFSSIGDNMHFRRKTEGKCDDKLMEGKYGRYMTSGSGRCRDQVDYRYNRDIAHDKRGKRRIGDSLDSLYNLQYVKTVGNDTIPIEHGPPAFYPYEKTRGPGYSGRKTGFPEKNTRYSRKNMDTESGRYGSDTYVVNGDMKDHRHHDHDRYIWGRHHRKFEVLPPRVDVYKPKHEDDSTFHSRETSYDFERISRNNRSDDMHASGRVTDRNDERELNRHRFKMMREDRINEFYGCHKFIQPRSCVQMHRMYQHSDDPLFVSEGKKITAEPGNGKSYDRQKDFDDFKTEMTVATSEKTDANIFDVHQKNEFLDIEEGQIITEENDEDTVVCGIIASENAISNGNGIVERIGEDRIREVIAKMEKRRERFKEPITSSKEAEKILLDSDVETAKGNIGRPARKRRWFGN